MLSHTFMGYVALWVLWGNTLLVGLAAATQALALLSRANRMSRSLLPARVVGSSPVARVSVEQVGRHAAGGAPGIVWHDRSYASEALPGELEIEGHGVVHVEPHAAAVWVEAEELAARAACPNAAAFDEAFAAARKIKGSVRTVEVTLDPGRSVWVQGEVVTVGGVQRLAPLAGELGFFTVHPRRYAAQRARFVFSVFLPGILLGAAVPTLLALHAPVFETLTGKVGALLALVFFLLVLPAGTAVRDYLRDPSRRILRGRWARPEDAAQTAVA